MDPAAATHVKHLMNNVQAQTLTAVKVSSASFATALVALFGGYFLFF